MTGKFDKFYIWMTPPKNGFRSIKKDAPEEIKIKAKKADEDYFKKTGRHMLKDLEKVKRYCVILAINIIMMFLIQREIL